MVAKSVYSKGTDRVENKENTEDTEATKKTKGIRVYKVENE